MRGFSVAMSVAFVVLCGAAPLHAQSATEGPLAAPDAPAVPAAKPTKPKRHKTAKAAHRAAPAADTPDYAAAPLPAGPHPVARSTAASPTDPVDFGMKWSGSNDSARETRVQNYNGDAEGTGAQVGMKLHF